MKKQILAIALEKESACAPDIVIRRAILFALAVVLVRSAACESANAQTWTGAGGDNNFSTASNWSPAAAPANDGSANLTFSGSTHLSPNADTPWAVASITFSTSAGAFSIGGQTLTLGAGGITAQQKTSSETVTAPIVLAASQTWGDLSQPNGGGFGVNNTINLNGYNLNLTATSGRNGPGGGVLNGTITGTGNITVTGGEYILRGNNMYVGSMNIDGSTLYVEPGCLGPASTPVNFNAGELAVDTSSNTTFAQNCFISSGGATLWTDAPQNTGPSFSGNFSGPGGLDIVNFGGVISLTGTNSYSGGTTVAASATLAVNTSSLPGNVVLQGGTLEFMQNSNGAYAGTISGMGNVLKYGTGNLSFGGTISGVGLNVDSGQFSIVGGNNVFSSVPLFLGGGAFALNNTNQFVLELAGQSGSVALGSGTLTFGSDNSSVICSASIGGAGGITKVGTGMETLAGSITYTGVTRVNAGTVLVESVLANNGSSGVLVNAGTDFSTASINRQLNSSSLAGIGSSASGDAAGLLGTGADLRAGKYTGLTTGYANMQWRVRTEDETPGTGQVALISDVLNLAGLALTSTGTHLQSGSYVLQMSYSPLGAPEIPDALQGSIDLDWFNTAVGGGIWQNATSGNFGTGLAGDVFFDVQSSWDAFAASHQITDSNVGNYLGSYGVDTTNHRVWAVLNYDSSYFDTSEFAVVPEPSSIALVVMGLLAMCWAAVARGRRRRTGVPSRSDNMG